MPGLEMTWCWTVGPELALVGYADGTVGFRHRCNGGGRWPDGETHLVDPLLQLEEGGHVLMGGTDGVPPTVTPSILCPDCQIHGFVTDGEWRPC